MWLQPHRRQLSERNRALKKQLDKAHKRQMEMLEQKKKDKLAELEVKDKLFKKKPENSYNLKIRQQLSVQAARKFSIEKVVL